MLMMLAQEAPNEQLMKLDCHQKLLGASRQVYGTGKLASVS
jgi:hypothetical protein